MYVLAASHSGSTLLSMLLGAHPEICTVGELKLPTAAMGDLREYLCSCGRLVLECPFWRRTRETLHRRGVPFDFEDPQMDFRQGGGRYADRLSRPLLRGPFVEF